MNKQHWKTGRFAYFPVAAGCILAVLSILNSCQTNTVTDVNVSMPDRNWSYVNKVGVTLEVKDASRPYIVSFRLRHTADYGYSNIFILLSLKGPGQKKIVKRYEYKLAQPDGMWLGSGSGNLFTHDLHLLTSYRFPVAGKYEIKVEQNMRDNPLKEISDVGLNVSEDQPND